MMYQNSMYYFSCSAAGRAAREREADVDVALGGAVRHDLGRRPLFGHAGPARLHAARPLQVLRRRPQVTLPGSQFTYIFYIHPLATHP